MIRSTRLERCVASAVMAGVALVASTGVVWAAKPLPSKTAETGGITVEAAPRRVDGRGAVIAITLDTHAGELDVNLRRGSTLTVDGMPWPVDSYRGDGPGGHHREGTLRFRGAGPATGSMRLVIRGLGGPVTLAWKLSRG